MICKCGFRNEEGDLYCAQCGRKLSEKKKGAMGWIIALVVVLALAAGAVAAWFLIPRDDAKKGSDTEQEEVLDEDEEEDPEDAPTEEEKLPEEETDPQDGWDQEHVFYYEDGEPAKGLKLLMDDHYYYFDPETGEKQTGWVEIEGAWHYFTEEGPAPGVGWYSDDVGWFYLEVDGKHHLESFTEDNRSYTLDEAGYLARMEYTELVCIESEDTVDGTKRPILMIPGTLSNCTGLTYRLVETGSITALDAPIWEIWICQEGEWTQVKEVSVSEEEGGYILSFGQPQSFEAICIVAPKDHRVDSTLRSVVLDF